MSGYSYPSRPYSPPPASRPPFPPRGGNPSSARGPYSPSGDRPPYNDPYREYSPPRNTYRRDAYNPPPSAAYDYEPYGSSHAYPQPSQPYDGGFGRPPQDQYDPYHPTPASSTPAYRPYSPPPVRKSPIRPARTPPARGPPPRDRPRDPPARPPPSRNYHTQPPPERAVSSTEPARETYLLTPPTWSIIAGAMTYIHQLPSSHLPLSKYVATSKAEAAALHKRLLDRANASLWYTDGSPRGGECWSSAVEWKMPLATSGKKTRECVGEGDALDAELGGMRKAAQAFFEDLPTRYADQPELIIFCDSQAAIVSLDTSTRPESRRFCELFEQALQRFPATKVTLVWIPGHYGIEGNELADKIAVVGATNSYLKRKKEGSLSYMYRTGPESEILPGASMRPGTWQSGSADPQAPEFKPVPTPPAGQTPATQDPYPELPPFPPTLQASTPLSGPPPMAEPEQVKEEVVEPAVETEQVVQPAATDDEQLEAKEGTLFVTNFPEHATARDIGILFGQFGSIVAVDIFSIPPIEPRFALVTFHEPAKSSPAAIAMLDRKAIPFDTEWALSHASDLDAWRGWDGTLVVALSEGGSLVPKKIAPMFPDLPEWAIGGGTAVGDVPAAGAKRGREAEVEELERKRQRAQSETSDMQVEEAAIAANVGEDGAAAEVEVSPSAPPAMAIQPVAMPPFPPKALPPFPPSLGVDTSQPTMPPTPSSAVTTTQPQPATATSVPISGITSVAAAQPILDELKMTASIRREAISRLQQLQTRFAAGDWVSQVNYLTEQLGVARSELGEMLMAAEEGRKDISSFSKTLAERGFSTERIEAFIKKVLAVLDGIAQEDAAANGGGETTTALNDLPTALQLVESLQHTCASLLAQLEGLMSGMADQTRKVVGPLERLYEIIGEAAGEAEKERDNVQRKAFVMEGMLSKGEVVGAVVGFLLSK